MKRLERAMSQSFGSGGRSPEPGRKAVLRLSHRPEDGISLYREFRKAQQSEGFSHLGCGYGMVEGAP
jgi:hypothetical protein